MGGRVLRRVPRRSSKKGLSRRHLEGRNMPFREYDPVGVRPIFGIIGRTFGEKSAQGLEYQNIITETRSPLYRGPKPQKCPKWLGEDAKGVLTSWRDGLLRVSCTNATLFCTSATGFSKTPFAPPS